MEQALAEVRELPGLGPFSADLVVVRGASAPDVFPMAERRLHEEMAERYAVLALGTVGATVALHGDLALG